MKAIWIAAALCLASTPAAADSASLASAFAKGDLTALRAMLPDPAARCVLGAVFAKKDDLPRAALYLEGCADLDLPAEISADVARAVRDTRHELQDTELSALQIITKPETVTAELDTLPGETVPHGATVWVKAGTHTVTATVNGKVFTNTVTVQKFARGAVILDARSAFAEPPKPRTKSIDMSEDNALEKTDGPPPDVKRGSMINKKLLGETAPRTGDEIADPLATPPPPAPLPIWLGVRFGGGLFDDAAASSQVRPSVGAAARYVLGDGGAFLAARIDWSRRGGAADSAVDVLGASAGAGYSVVDADAVGVALIGQLRGDLRFADTRNAMSVSRAGASAAAGVEVAFPATPLTAGLRFEQGLTELVPGARDRALLVELGVDWR